MTVMTSFFIEKPDPALDPARFAATGGSPAAAD